MKQVICVGLLGLFCSNAVLGNGKEEARAVHANGKNDTNVEVPVQSGRIVNGLPVDIARYGFALSLRVDNRIVCGASAISYSFALTSASCVYQQRNSVERVTLYGGSNSPTSGGSLFRVVRIAIHPNYNPNVRISDYNIAVLSVPSNAFSGKPNVAPIALAFAGVGSGTRCSVFGWGRTNANVPAPANELRYAEMIIVSEATCLRVLAPFSIPVTSNMLCAKGDNGADMCFGDFGGALVCNRRLTGVNFLINSGCDNAREIAFMKIISPNIRSFIRSQTNL